MSDELEKRVKILQEEVIKHKRINEEMKETYEKQNKLKEEIIDKLKKENDSIKEYIINYQKSILNLNDNITKLTNENKQLLNQSAQKEINFKNVSKNEKELYLYNKNIRKEIKYPLDLIKINNNISKACCRLEYTINDNKIYGNGFFMELPISNTTSPIKGLMTSNNFINEDNINNPIEIKIIFNIIQKSLILTNKNNFKFTDCFLNFTFIQLNENELDELKTFDINFLQINEDKEIPNQIILIQNHLNGEITIENGVIISEWGYQLFHTIPNSFDFIGSPLISLSTNKVISILTNNKNCKYNPSTNIKLISQVIKNIYTTEINEIKYKVKQLSKTEIEELKKIGLKQTTSELIFESPASFFVTPLWFYRTNHNWYWTPVDPNLKNKKALPCNWLIICPNGSLKVVGGCWSEKEPAPNNIELIHWLEKNGFKYLV